MELTAIKATYRQWRTTLLLRIREERELGFNQRRGTIYRLRLAYDLRQRRRYFGKG